MNAKEFGIRMYAAIQAKHKREEFQEKINNYYPNHALDMFMREKQRRYWSNRKSS